MGMCYPSLGLVLNYCRSIICSTIGCSLVHVRQSANQVANCLEKVSVSRSDIGEWGVSPPSFLVDVLANDLK